jgi:exopolysaccharide production protein ExoQ
MNAPDAGAVAPRFWSRARASVVAGLALLVCTNGPVLIPVRLHVNAGAVLETPEVRRWFVAVAVLGAILVVVGLVRRRLSAWSTSSAGLMSVAAFVGLIGGSTLWSVDRSLTLSRSLIYAGLAAFAFWLGASSSVDRCSAVTFMAALGVGASIVTVVLWPDVATDPVGDTWRGLYTGRNSLAPVAAIGTLGGGSMLLERRSRSWSLCGAALGIVSMVALMETHNKTAPIAMTVAVAVPIGYLLVRSVDRDRGEGAGRTGRAALLLFGLVATWPIVDAVWSTGTFETRRQIWGLVRSRIEQRPLQGYGFSVLWDTPAYSADLYAEVGTVFGSAHNSWMEVWLGAGAFGLLAYSLVVGLALWTAVSEFRASPNVASGFWLALVIFLVLENLSESFVLWYSYNWVLLAAAAVRRPLAADGEGLSRERSACGRRPRSRGRDTTRPQLPDPDLLEPAMAEPTNDDAQLGHEQSVVGHQHDGGAALA